MKLTSNEPERGVRVEMAPILDVVFLLLVFFIYSFLSMSVQKGIKVNLPKADGATETGKKIQIVLSAENAFYLDERLLPRDELVAKVAEQHMQTGYPVLIRTDRDAKAGPALELMGALRKQGVEQLSYQVEAEK